jgi:signal transduction histidine kinase
MDWLRHRIYTRFSVLCLFSVVVLALAMGFALSSLLTSAVSEGEWQNTAALVTRDVKTARLEAIFTTSGGPEARARLGHRLSRTLTTLPEVVRATVWSPEAEILWSDEAHLIGQRFGGNEELKEALEGKVEVMFSTRAEIYVPIFANDGRVLGVVEVSKTPDRLLKTIRWSRIVIWTISLGGGALVYVVLLPLFTQVYRRQVEDETLRRHASRLEREVEERTQQLLQARKMQAVGLLAGGIAHDFNNVLTVIFARAQMLLAHPESNRVGREQAESIMDDAQRASGLTRQLFTFSRKGILQRRPVDLNTVILEMARMLRRVTGEHITMVTDLGGHARYVNADRAQLEQVVLHLVVNARDAMPQGGHLVLATESLECDGRSPMSGLTLPAGRFIELLVSDTGTGMDEATQARIFEPFFTTKAAGHGTGLGLSTVYGIVQQHEGHIAVASAPDKGTTFRLYFPQVDEPAPVTDPSVPEALGGSETILLAEDDRAIQALAAAILREHGYTVLTADNGEHALEVAEQHDGPIDVLLTDVVMPRLNGAQLSARLGTGRPAARVLYMTGYAGMPGLPDGRILQKPFTTDAPPCDARDHRPGGGRRVRLVLCTPAFNAGAAAPPPPAPQPRDGSRGAWPPRRSRRTSRRAADGRTRDRSRSRPRHAAHRRYVLPPHPPPAARVHRARRWR